MTATSIEWTDASWNPVRGCARVSAGCENCYAEQVARRFAGPGLPYEGLVRIGKDGKAKAQWSGEVRFVADKLAEPLTWRKPKRVFVNSMSDLFHEGVSFEQIAAVFGVMAAAPQHTFQVLTKRPERAKAFFRWYEGESGAGGSPYAAVYEARSVLAHTGMPHVRDALSSAQEDWPLANVWLGVSVEDQASADTRIPHLLECPAAVRWVSCEPMLASVDLAPYLGGSYVRSGNRVLGIGGVGHVLDGRTRSHLAPQRVDEGVADGVGSGACAAGIITPGGRERFRPEASREHEVSARDVRVEGAPVEGGRASCGVDAGERRADSARPGDQPSQRERRGQLACEPGDRDSVSERHPCDTGAGREAESSTGLHEPAIKDRRDRGDEGSRDGGRALDASMEDCGDVRDIAADRREHQSTEDLAAPPRLTWVVVGGESGPGARPFDLAWARSVIAQCAEVGTACFTKQLGAHPVDPSRSSVVDNLGTVMHSVAHEYAERWAPHYEGGRVVRPAPVNIRDRKGAAMIDWPADLRVRQWPGESR